MNTPPFPDAATIFSATERARSGFLRKNTRSLKKSHRSFSPANTAVNGSNSPAAKSPICSGCSAMPPQNSTSRWRAIRDMNLRQRRNFTISTGTRFPRQSPWATAGTATQRIRLKPQEKLFAASRWCWGCSGQESRHPRIMRRPSSARSSNHAAVSCSGMRI